jgi:ABC-2 type transport system ATP-binding protein
VDILEELASAGGRTVTEPAVELVNVSLAYRLARNRASTFKEFVLQLMKRQVTYEELWAVRDASFRVMPGEVFGVIGPNGAGKSTLMKMIARVLPPTEGRVVVRGAVGSMIELAVGFNGELTAEENIVMYGILMGQDRSHMKTRVQPIAEWAGLTDFLDVPVRSFSSGMLARLGFAVATDTQPDVLVIDEVLAVGDEEFQEKSRSRIMKMITGGTAVLLVSHDLDTITELAESVLWLDHGVTRDLGPAGDVVGAYRRSVHHE